MAHRFSRSTLKALLGSRKRSGVAVLVSCLATWVFGMAFLKPDLCDKFILISFVLETRSNEGVSNSMLQVFFWFSLWRDPILNS